MPNCTNKTFDYLQVNNMHSVNQWRTGNEHEIHDTVEDWVRVELTNNLRMHSLLNLTKLQCVHRGLMLPWKVHQIYVSLKTIFKELIFTVVEGKSPVCDSTNVSVHVHLLEHTTVPVELPQPCWRYSTWQLLKIYHYILSSIRFLICKTELK